MRHEILEHQNDETQIQLLRASTAAYVRAKRGEIIITWLVLFLALAYPVTYLFLRDDNVKLILLACSFLLTLIIQVITPVLQGNTSKGAVFKEEFDTSLFNMRWKWTLKRPDPSSVIYYSRHYRGPAIRNWYSTNLSSSIPFNTAVAILQRSNTHWDIALRKKFRKWIINFLIFYSFLLLTAFIILQTDALTIFYLLLSLLSFFIHFISLIRGHSAAIERRQSISAVLDDAIHGKRILKMEQLRDIQDEIYLTRQESAKVPNFFFHRYHEQLKEEAEEYIEQVNRIYSS